MKKIGFTGSIFIVLIVISFLNNLLKDKPTKESIDYENYKLESKKNEIRNLVSGCQSRGFSYSSCIKGYDPEGLTK